MLWVMPAPATAVAPWEGKMQNEMEACHRSRPTQGQVEVLGWETHRQRQNPPSIRKEAPSGLPPTCWVRARVRSRCSVASVKCRFCFMRRLTSKVVKRVGRRGSLRVTCSHESPSSSTSHSSLARCRPRTHTCWGPGAKMGEREGGSAGGGGGEDEDRLPPGHPHSE